jgi:hypothetical protein
VPTISQAHPVLPPQVRARTILAGCVRVDLADLDLADLDLTNGVPPAIAGATALLEWGGSPFLAARSGLQLPGRVRLTCRADVEGLGVLRLTGTCEDPQPLETMPALHRLVRSEFDPDGLSVAQVVLESVRVLRPASGDVRAQSISVPLDGYFAAAPDVWALHGAHVAEHLEQHHQAELRALATDCLDGAPVCEVLVRGISSAALDLGCLLPEGVSSLRVAFPDPIADPVALADWLTARLRRIAEGPRD